MTHSNIAAGHHFLLKTTKRRGKKPESSPGQLSYRQKRKLDLEILSIFLYEEFHRDGGGGLAYRGAPPLVIITCNRIKFKKIIP